MGQPGDDEPAGAHTDGEGTPTAPTAPAGPTNPSPAAGPTGEALAPLRARYASWMSLDAGQVLADRGEDPDRVRALQLVLRLERDRAPDWYAALELAARGCAALCLDPRSEPGGEWYPAIRDYCTGHIRKVTRRARAGHWAAAGDLPGITLATGDTEVRALLPGPARDLDRRISRLQVGGTDTPRTEPAAWAQVPAGALLLHPAPDLAMTLGKAMAQAGHAGMIAGALLAADRPGALGRWSRAGLPVAVRPVARQAWEGFLQALADPSRAWREGGLLAVRDAGFTEIRPGTVTVVAIAPRDRPAQVG